MLSWHSPAYYALRSIMRYAVRMMGGMETTITVDSIDQHGTRTRVWRAIEDGTLFIVTRRDYYRRDDETGEQRDVFDVSVLNTATGRTLQPTSVRTERITRACMEQEPAGLHYRHDRMPMDVDLVDELAGLRFDGVGDDGKAADLACLCEALTPYQVNWFMRNIAYMRAVQPTDDEVRERLAMNAVQAIDTEIKRAESDLDRLKAARSAWKQRAEDWGATLYGIAQATGRQVSSVQRW